MEDVAIQNNENLINRDFTAEGLNERLLYDIIEVPCRVADIAAVLEKSSGRIACINNCISKPSEAPARPKMRTNDIL